MGDTESDSWINDLDIHPGDHTIAIVTNESQLSLLPGYNKYGLELGRTCSIVTTSEDRDDVRKELLGGGISVDEAEEAQKLMFIDPMEVGGTEDGWKMDTFFERLEAFVEDAASKGETHIQNSGSAHWLLDVGSPMDAIRFEARLNLVFERRPISGF